jgi:hypothetical protein
VSVSEVSHIICKTKVDVMTRRLEDASAAGSSWPAKRELNRLCAKAKLGGSQGFPSSNQKRNFND